MKNRIIYYDILRTISIIAVIVIHVIGNTINTFNLSGIPMVVYKSIWQLMYFAVPMFVVISGGIFLNPEKDITLKDLYKKYILRILIALFAFGIIYSLIEIYFINKTLNLGSLILAIKNVFTGNLWAHMWYLYLILGLYIISPILKVFIKNCSMKQLQYLLLILFIFTIIIPEISAVLNFKIAFNILVTSPYILLYLLGFYLTKYDIPKKYRIANYIFSIIFVILIIINNFLKFFDANIITYTSIGSFSIVISLFLLAKNLNLHLNNKTQKILKNISECGFGIYLIHQLIINVIYKLLKIDIITKIPYIGLVIYTLLIFGMSFAIVYYLRKIKIVKKYIF